MSRDREWVLPLRATPQPLPAIYKDGDCGPCCLGPLIGLSPAEVYSWGLEEEQPRPLTWMTIHSLLRKASNEELIDEAVHETPIWETHEAHWIWGPSALAMSSQWFRYLTLAIDAGYYGLAMVDADRRGPQHHGNHWVLIVGYRERWVPIEAPEVNASTLQQSLLISCSSTKTLDEEWITVQDFLGTMGGYNALLVRPNPRS